jgi:nitrite reductase (NO-forming)
MRGTQSVIAGPTDSWVIDWVVPAAGPYTLVSHAFGTQAIKGAIGIIDAQEDAPRVGDIISTGPTNAIAENPKRFVDPFGLGDDVLDHPHRFRAGDRVQIQMVGNSYWPKRAEVPVGSTVTWVNEDVFDFLEGERTGQHNAVTVAAEGPEPFFSPLLKHAETFSHTFTQPGTYEYICSIHPYMRAKVTVYE